MTREGIGRALPEEPMSEPSTRRVMLAKSVAGRWLKAHARPEYRMKVYYGARDMRYLPGLLRSFRNEYLKVGSINPIPDLGIKEAFDHLEVWTSDRNGLMALKEWCEKRGCETTGVW